MFPVGKTETPSLHQAKVGPPHPIYPPAAYAVLAVVRRSGEGMCPPRGWYTDVSSSIIYNSQKVETTQIAIACATDKQNGVYPDNRRFFDSTKKGRTDTCHRMDESWRHCAQRKKPATEDHVWLHMIPFIGTVRNGDIFEREIRLMVARGWGQGQGAR